MMQIHNESGFTLVELILVLALIASTGAMTTAYMARFLTQNAVSNTTDQLIGDFRNAQLNAMVGKQGSNWGVSYSSNTIYLYEGSSFAGRNTAFDQTFPVAPTVTISGLSDVNFARMTGVPSTTGTITISDNTNDTKTIIIFGQGTVTR